MCSVSKNAFKTLVKIINIVLESKSCLDDREFHKKLEKKLFHNTIKMVFYEFYRIMHAYETSIVYLWTVRWVGSKGRTVRYNTQKQCVSLCFVGSSARGGWTI